jgi:hypothetical protein
MARSHISILVVRKIVAGDRSRLIGSCYPGMNRGPSLCNSPGKRADQKCARKLALSERACQVFLVFLSMCSTRTRATNVRHAEYCASYGSSRRELPYKMHPDDLKLKRPPDQVPEIIEVTTQQ